MRNRTPVQLSLFLSLCLLEVAAKHISKTTAITSVQWHAIYMVLPGEINFVVTTHKINNSERNSGHSSAERNSIITGHELQHSPSPAEECSLSLDYLYHFVWRGTFSSKQLMPSILIYMLEQRISCYNLQQNVF